MEIPISILTQRNLSLQKFTLGLHASIYLRANNHWPTILRAFSSVQFSRSVVSDSATPWTAVHQAPLSITNSWSLLKLMSIVGGASQPSYPVVPFSSCPQSFPVSGSLQMSQLFALDVLIDHHACCMLGHFSGIRLCDPMDHSLPGSSAHGILQARILEWTVMPSFRESS